MDKWFENNFEFAAVVVHCYLWDSPATKGEIRKWRQCIIFITALINKSILLICIFSFNIICIFSLEEKTPTISRETRVWVESRIILADLCPFLSPLNWSGHCEGGLSWDKLTNLESHCTFGREILCKFSPNVKHDLFWVFNFNSPPKKIGQKNRFLANWAPDSRAPESWATDSQALDSRPGGPTVRRQICLEQKNLGKEPWLRGEMRTLRQH